MWEVNPDWREFLAAWATIMQREYKPFLSGEQAFQANAKALECHIREELDKWYDWLPDTPINRIGGGLAVEIVESSDWDQGARLAQDTTLPTKVPRLAAAQPGGGAEGGSII